MRQRFITELRKLYLVEAVAREQQLGPEQRKALRQEKSKPVWTALLPELEQAVAQNLPQSPLGKAARYCLNEWTALTRYLEDGRLEIDNNLTENAIRPSAVGKKNWLFIGHPEAGWRSAVIYSIVVSCRRRKIDPWEYLRISCNACRRPRITTSPIWSRRVGSPPLLRNPDLATATFPPGLTHAVWMTLRFK